MPDAALSLYTSLDSYDRINELVTNGQPEGIHLECKAPQEPRLTQDVQLHLGKTACAFANTAGGVMLYGVETQRHAAKKLDVIKQITFIGNAEDFKRQIEAHLPGLTTPPILGFQAKVIRQNETDTKGVIALYVPRIESDPLICNADQLFYYRLPDGCHAMPYDMIKRLFAATESPDLTFELTPLPKDQKPDGTVYLNVMLRNQSSAVAENVDTTIIVANVNDFESVVIDGTFIDRSAINPGKHVWMAQSDRVVHKGLQVSMGNIAIKLKPDAGHTTALVMEIHLFANKMAARGWAIKLQLEPEITALGISAFSIV